MFYCRDIQPDDDDSIEFIPSNRGKGVLLVHKSYTYASMTSKTRWYCSKKASGCRAKIITTEEGQFLQLVDIHSHLPPRLFRTNDGKVIRI
ncbi:FLYWCH zinc finger domain-containing protein [Phthorimaea operculella]|nr:FLYWCH zinc finger domain-containing protein [Phthorimaea operculella]